ncbi:sensor histidine kinase [Methanohalophilus profundi]|uniref:sensor histidine kinase n=1 Tax=Methanohalophilus profundi TaxID=2138083 RepID=UPI0013EA669B|nr:sensor histidine kinase [Methanohalophilus profundi]
MVDDMRERANERIALIAIQRSLKIRGMSLSGGNRITTSKISLLRILTFCLIMSAAVLMPMSVCQAQEDTVRIGVQSDMPDYMTLQQWEMTTEYLSQEIPGHSFEIIPLSYDEMLIAADNGDVDIVVCSPVLEVALEYKYGASAIATRMNNWQGESYQIHGAVVITRADRDDINDLSDLKGRSFAATPENSFAWRIVQRLMMNEGIDPYTDLKSELGHSHRAVIDAVINGDVDAGAVRVGTLEQMVLEGTLDIDNIKGIHLYRMNMDDGESDTRFHIIGGQVIKGVPFIHSTSLYPEWAFTRLPYTNVDLAGNVAKTLHTMPVSSAIDQDDRYAGWGTPLSYQPVHKLMQELQIGPYEHYGEVSLVDAVSKYWYIPLLLIFIILLMMIYLRKLTSLNQELKSESSRRKQAEQTLKKYADELEYSNETKDIFTDIMRHDLLNPINIINGFTDLLLGTETDESKRHKLENIKLSNEQLIEMIKNASKFSKLDATESIQLETTDIGSLMEKAAYNLKHESTTKQMDIKLPVGGPYTASANSIIVDVFVNLLSNAIKYSPAGSRITTDVLDAGDMWKVTVTDAGEGIADEDKTLIFERFKRVHKKSIKGSGLGLAIVKRIIDCMAEMWV